jgi:hypothetical protein
MSWPRPKRPGLASTGHSGEWRNWQTRRIQVPVSERMWGFKSPLAHSHRATDKTNRSATAKLGSTTSMLVETRLRGVHLAVGRCSSSTSVVQVFCSSTDGRAPTRSVEEQNRSRPQAVSGGSGSWLVVSIVATGTLVRGAQVVSDLVFRRGGSLRIFLLIALALAFRNSSIFRRLAPKSWKESSRLWAARPQQGRPLSVRLILMTQSAIVTASGRTAPIRDGPLVGGFEFADARQSWRRADEQSEMS